MQISQADLRSFARTVLSLVGQTQPDLAPAGQATCLPGSVGSRNYLWKVKVKRGVGLLKLRSDPTAECSENEGELLEQLPNGVGPSLWTQISLSQLREQAAKAKDLKALKALDLPIGDGLLMSWEAGDVVEGPFAYETLYQVGRALAELHQGAHTDDQEELQRLPRHNFPQRPGAMLRVCDDLFDELQERELLEAETEEFLEAALDELHEHEGLKRLKSPSRWGLCHGDLRWHNMLFDGDTLRLIDWEDGGWGDPAIDLAQMTCRIPLSWWEELSILEAYTAPPYTYEVADRFFVMRPLVGLLCAMSAVLDLADAAEGQRATAEPLEDFLADRWPAMEEELEDAIQRVLGVWQPLPPIQINRPTPVTARLDREPPAALIAIDGPSVSFKSPFAAGLSAALGLPHYNKGALFRYVALWAYCHNKRPHIIDHRRAVINHIKRAKVALSEDGAVIVGGTTIREALALGVVELRVAAWAALPQIRAALQPIFEALTGSPAIIEGRDVGTELAPHADLKLFVTAPDKARIAALVHRSGATRAQAKEWIRERDEQDTTRQHGSLRQAKDAVVVTLHPDELEDAIATWTQTIRKTFPPQETP